VTEVWKRGRAVAVIGVLALSFGAAACSDDGGGTDKDSAECQPYKDFQGDFNDKRVTAFSPIRGVEADKFEEAWKTFEDCTGIDVRYEGTGEFESQIPVRVDGGNPPDVAFFPQPGLLQRFATAGKLKAASAKTKELATANFSKDWLAYGTVGGTFYAAPLGANVKSFVWYSPQLFKEKNYKVPTSWDEMMTLSNKMVADGVRPWCVGIESGVATGWPVTDWLEDVLLRTEGPEFYDQWVTHKVPFNDPKVVAALDRVGSIMKNPQFVGDVKRISTLAFQEGGLPVAEKKCGMHRQASFYANNWKDGTKVGEDADVFAFYFPPIDSSKGKPVLGGGEFVAAFADRPEVQAFQAFLATEEFANLRAKTGSWVTANNKVDPSLFAGPIDQLSVKILQDPGSVFRFDGSDLMPSSVGSGTFWKAATDWVNGKDTKSTLDFIESSWPT